MADNLESLERMVTDKIASAGAGHHGKIALAQSRILFGGIGQVSQEDFERSTRQRQILGVVDSAFLRKIPDWEVGVTSHMVAQSLLDKFGSDDLGIFLDNYANNPLTQDRRVIEVNTAITEAIAKDKQDEKTA